MNSVEKMAKIQGVAVAWQQMLCEFKENKLTKDQFDMVTDVALDVIGKTIAEREKA